MKLYIVADMEGIAGVVAPEQVSCGSGWEYDQARRQFTEEVCAICSGAIEAGAEEIVVNDFHGNGRNIDLALLPQQVQLIRGEFRPTSGFDLLDSSFHGLILLGAHARSGSRGSILPHTYSSKVQFELFGQPVGEFDILSFLAGEYKVPTILISGDDKTISQAHTNLPSTAAVMTKYSIGSNSAVCVHPKRVCEMLRTETRRVVKDIGSIEPPMISPPIQLVFRVVEPRLAERLDWIPRVKRLDGTTFEFIGETMSEIARLAYGIAELTAS